VDCSHASIFDGAWRRGLPIFLQEAGFGRAARLAAIPAGESPANRRSPVTVVVITSNGEGDQSVESLVVKVPEGWGVPVRSVQGGEQPGRP
jgi:hypothetical protein